MHLGLHKLIEFFCLLLPNKTFASMGAVQSSFTKQSTAREVADAFKIHADGQIAIVTGGNSGIGAECVKALVHAGATVYLCSRSIEAGQRSIERDMLENHHGDYSLTSKQSERIRVKQLDLQSLSSIKSFAEDVISELGDQPIGLLILNAGIMSPPKLGHTAHGWEQQMATNHFGHAYLTSLLLPKMLEQKIKSRIVCVSSLMHRLGSINVLDLHYKHGRGYDPVTSYGQSKLANVLFAKSLADKCKGSPVTAYALHPGVIHTGLMETYKPGMHREDFKLKGSLSDFLYSKFVVDRDIPQGASTTIFGALAPELEGQSGAYLANCRVTAPSRRGADAGGKLREALWRTTYDQINEELAKIGLPKSFEP
jgi:NAD(P)-dependent dehydrogenase (short-subunit alcohol dehydrogenase family)